MISFEAELDDGDSLGDTASEMEEEGRGAGGKGGLTALAVRLELHPECEGGEEREDKFGVTGRERESFGG